MGPGGRAETQMTARTGQIKDWTGQKPNKQAFMLHGDASIVKHRYCSSELQSLFPSTGVKWLIAPEILALGDLMPSDLCGCLHSCAHTCSDTLSVQIKLTGRSEGGVSN